MLLRERGIYSPIVQTGWGCRTKNRLRGGNLGKEENVVLLVSDMHCGKETATFNVEILNARFQRVISAAERITGILQKGYRLEDIHICFLGDIVDGDGIYPTQKHHTDKQAGYARQQVLAARDIIVPGIDRLKNCYRRIHLHGVPGNHGRVGRFTHEANNFDCLLYDMLTQEFKRSRRIHCDFTDNFYQIVDVGGPNGLLLYHGKGIRSYQSIPLYGIQQRVMKWRNGGLKFGAVAIGHFHQYGNLRVGETEIFLTGTAVTDDKFALENYGADGHNYWHFMGVHPDRGYTWRYPLHVSE